MATPATVTNPGNYQLIVVNSSGCSDTALVTLNNDVQLCPPVVEKIVISPNPVIDNLKVLIGRRTASKVEIVVHNSSGQIITNIVKQQSAGTQSYLIPMKQAASGMYYVTVFIDEQKQVVKKIMKQ